MQRYVSQPAVECPYGTNALHSASNSRRSALELLEVAWACHVVLITIIINSTIVPHVSSPGIRCVSRAPCVGGMKWQRIQVSRNPVSLSEPTLCW
jgi:hypothetical protein